MTTLLDKLFGTYLVIEFKEDSLVVAYLKNSSAGMMLHSSSTFTLKDHDTTVNEVREYIGQHGAGVDKVFISIPDKWAINKFIDIPSMKGKGKGALANLMRFEIERHIPFEIDDVAYDFMVLDEADGKYTTFFVVAQKERVDFVKDFLDKLTLQPDTITLSSYAVLNTVELDGISAGGWQDIIGIVRKSDSLGRKGETNALLYVEKAFPGKTPVDYIQDISICLNEAQAIIASGKIDRLILAGEESTDNIFRQELEKNYVERGVAVGQASRFTGSIRGVQLNGLSSSVGACYAGLGIGTYNINLLPHKLDYEIKKIAPLATKIFTAMLVIIIMAILVVDILKQGEAVREIDAALEANKPLVNVLEKLSSDVQSIKKSSDILHDIKDGEMTLEILAELAAILPKDSWITNLNYKGFEIEDKKKKGGELIINGFAASSSILIPLLEDSPLFEKVEFVGSIKKTKEKEQFKLSARILRPSDNVEGQTETQVPVKENDNAQ
jgi:Tfp pilus assembly protein PilN